MAEPVDPSRLSFRRFALLFAALFSAAAVPALICDTLPLFDYPNHLARMHVLVAWSDSVPLQRFYAVDWRPLPNLAMDVVVPPLAKAMPLAWAAKVFVLLTLLLIAGGAAALHRSLFARWSAWPCLVFLLLYSRMLLWGFLNYLFGLGLGLVAFALWVALAGRKPVLRLAVGAAFALVLFFAHLLACGLYGVLVVGHAAGRVWRREARSAAAELLIAGVPFLVPLAILLLATPGSAGGAVVYGNMLRKLDLLFSVFDNYSRPFDVAGFVIAAVSLLVAFRRGWIRLAPAMAAPVGLLTLVYLVMPSQLATASGADHRLPLLLGLVLIAGSRWTAPDARRQSQFLGAALLLFLIRLGVVTASWQASDRVYASLLPALDQLPAGDRLAVAYPPQALNSQPTPLVHLPTLAVLHRDAFVPTLFAFPTQQPVLLQPPYRALADRLPPERLWAAFVDDGPPLDAAERAALAGYDHIVFVGRVDFAPPTARPLVPVFAAPRFALFAVAADGAALDGAGPAR